MNARLGTVLACSLLLLAVGCGHEDSGSAADEPSSSPGTNEPGTPSPTTTPTTLPPTTPPSEALEKVRVVGELVQVGDCTVVEDDNGTTWTVGDPPAQGFSAGDRVQVTGTPNIAATGCGGPLLEDTRVTPAP